MRSLGKYRLIAEIARGGMGIVYLALMQGPAGFTKLVVVKELKPELAEETSFLTMFLDEAKLAARLNHPNILQTHEVGNDGLRYFMAMDYLDGRGWDRIRRRANTPGGLTLQMQLRVLCDVLAGLDYAHRFTDLDGTPLHIVHRDISPQNIFVTFDGQVKVIDFGIAKTVSSQIETRAGMLKGKLTYMAPEQARAEKLDARADVFAVGVLLWEAITGRGLRQGQSEAQILGDLVNSVELPSPSSIKPTIAPELDEICCKALAPKRDNRYATAGAFAKDLEKYLASIGNVTTRDVGEYVAGLFKDERAQTTSMIEAQVARVRAGSPDDDLPMIDVSFGAVPVDLRTPVPRESSSLPQIGTTQRVVGTLDVATSSQTPQSLTAVTPAAGKKKLALIAVPIAALAIGGVVYASRGGDPPAPQPPPVAQPAPAAPVPAPAAALPVPPPAPAPPPQAGLIAVDVATTPKDATITIDGADVPSNPFRGRYVNDGAMHRVQISAPGYVPRTEAVSFDHDVSLTIALDKVPVAAARAQTYYPPSRPAVRTVAPTPPPAEVEHPTPPTLPAIPPTTMQTTKPDPIPTGGVKPKHTIDPNNPYAK